MNTVPERLLTRRGLPLNMLRTFEVAARRESLVAAAAELAVTHGAVSRQIKQLEAALGMPLFKRSGRSLVLNASGMRLQAVVTTVLDDLTEGLRQLSPDALEGPLTVACTASIAANWLNRFLGTFVEKFPEIELHLEMIEPTQRHLRDSFDVAICFGEPESEGCDVELLYSEHFFPVISPKALTAGGSLKQPSDLLDFSLIHDRVDHWPKWLRAAGLQQQRASKNLFVQEAHLSLDGARAGLGVALCDSLEVAPDLEMGTLLRPFELTISANHAIYLAVNTRRIEDARVQVFCSWIRQWIQEVV